MVAMKKRLSAERRMERTWWQMPEAVFYSPPAKNPIATASPAL